MSIFPPIHEIVPVGVVGCAEIKHDTPSKLEIMRSNWKGGGFGLEERTYTRLLVNGRLFMTDADFEHRSNWEVTHVASGDVLLVGLGIGMLLTRILPKDTVRSVTVVEKYRDVIQLVGPHFQNPRLSIIEGDIWEWLPKPGTKFDTIYFDIWLDVCTDNLDDMTKLHRRFRKFLAPGGWMNSWCREYLRAERRRGD